MDQVCSNIHELSPLPSLRLRIDRLHRLSNTHGRVPGTTEELHELPIRINRVQTRLSFNTKHILVGCQCCDSWRTPTSNRSERANRHCARAAREKFHSFTRLRRPTPGRIATIGLAINYSLLPYIDRRNLRSTWAKPLSPKNLL